MQSSHAHTHTHNKTRDPPERSDVFSHYIAANARCLSPTGYFGGWCGCRCVFEVLGGDIEGLVSKDIVKGVSRLRQLVAKIQAIELGR